jgi:hypothetical protein
LVNAISAELAPDTTGVIDPAKFQALQDVAAQGKKTLHEVLDTAALSDQALSNPDDAAKKMIEELIQEVYAWETALRAYRRA